MPCAVPHASPLRPSHAMCAIPVCAQKALRAPPLYLPCAFPFTLLAARAVRGALSLSTKMVVDVMVPLGAVHALPAQARAVRASGLGRVGA
eukprot:scaffold2835_cov105-Isochrysis_galbana.AAC.7